MREHRIGSTTNQVQPEAELGPQTLTAGSHVHSGHHENAHGRESGFIEDESWSHVNGSSSVSQSHKDYKQNSPHPYSKEGAIRLWVETNCKSKSNKDSRTTLTTSRSDGPSMRRFSSDGDGSMHFTETPTNFEDEDMQNTFKLTQNLLRRLSSERMKVSHTDINQGLIGVVCPLTNHPSK